MNTSSDFLELPQAHPNATVGHAGSFLSESNQELAPEVRLEVRFRFTCSNAQLRMSVCRCPPPPRHTRPRWSAEKFAVPPNSYVDVAVS